MENILLKKEQYETIIAHCMSTLPYEAVGLLAGNQNGEIIKSFPLINDLKQENSFFVNPYSQFKVQKLIKEAQLIPLALYHSHPTGLPILSETDIYFAKKNNFIQVVVSLSLNIIKAYEVNQNGDTKELRIIIC